MLIRWLFSILVLHSVGAAAVMMPVIEGEWWTVAGDPDLGAYTDAKQQPVDFAVWQAGDGTWQQAPTDQPTRGRLDSSAPTCARPEVGTNGRLGRLFT